MYDNLKSKFYRFYDPQPSTTKIPKIDNKNLLSEVLEEFKPEKRKRKKGYYFENHENFGLRADDKIYSNINSKEFDSAFDHACFKIGLFLYLTYIYGVHKSFLYN